jgi:uncharacterized protein DUF2849
MTAPQQQKLKVTGPVIVTANRLGDGAVVYRTSENGWSANLQSARVVTRAADATQLLREALSDELRAVGAYVASVRIDSRARLSPANLRERIRSEGPTIAQPNSRERAPRHVLL